MHDFYSWVVLDRNIQGSLQLGLDSSNEAPSRFRKKTNIGNGGSWCIKPSCVAQYASWPVNAIFILSRPSGNIASWQVTSEQTQVYLKGNTAKASAVHIIKYAFSQVLYLSLEKSSHLHSHGQCICLTLSFSLRRNILVYCQIKNKQTNKRNRKKKKKKDK